MRGLVVRLMLSVCLAPLVSSLNGAARAMEGALPVSVDWLAQYAAVVAVVIMTYVYWTAIWFGAVRWTARRRKLTVLAVLCSLLTGIGFVILYVGVNNTYSMGQVSWDTPNIFRECQAPAIAAWLLGTTLVWRETAGERRQRMHPASQRLIGAVHCPNCTYNMTGLFVTRCPECGTQYTIETLLAANIEDADLDAPLRR